MPRAVLRNAPIRHISFALSKLFGVVTQLAVGRALFTPLRLQRVGEPFLHLDEQTMFVLTLAEFFPLS